MASVLEASGGVGLHMARACGAWVWYGLLGLAEKFGFGQNVRVSCCNVTASGHADADFRERGGGASGHGDTEAQAGRASIGAASRRNTSNLTPSSTAQAQGQNSNNPQTETPLPYSHLFRRFVPFLSCLCTRVLIFCFLVD